jgi:hypothetical protein
MVGVPSPTILKCASDESNPDSYREPSSANRTAAAESSGNAQNS